MEARRRYEVSLLLVFIGMYSILRVTSVEAQPANLIGYWRLDESSGTVASDASGLGHTASLTGGVSWNTGKFGSAALLDGQTGYIRFSMPDATLGRTRAAWIKASSAIGSRGLISNSDWVPGSLHFRLDGSQVVSGINGGAVITAPITTGEWHHVATTYDAASGALRIYIDGVEAAATSTTNGLIVQGEDFIGNEYTDGRYFQGLIDDVRIYDRALTALEIQEIYTAPTDTTTTPDPLPDPTPDPTLPAPPTDLAGYWRLDEGSGALASDASGLGHVASLTGGISWTIGKDSSSVLLDGRTGFLRLSMPNATVGRTRAAWINAIGTSGYQGLISNSDWVPGSLHFRLDNGRIISGINGGTTIFATITAGEWHHVATTYDAASGAFRIYIDGAEAAATYTNIGLIIQGEDFIGNEYTDGRYFNGLIDDVRIYDRALTASEVQAIYVSPGDSTTIPDPIPDPTPDPIPDPTPTVPPADMIAYWRLDEGSGTLASDVSEFSNTGTLVQGASWAPGKFGSAISLDGQGSHISIPMSNATLGRTRAAWIYATSTSGYRGLISNSDWTRGSLHFRIDNGRIVSGINGGSTISAPITANAWHHVATTYDAASGAFRIFIDGAEAAATFTNNGLTVQGEDFIGREYVDGRYFQGMIDDVRIYDRALQAAEVEALYTSIIDSLPPVTAFYVSPTGSPDADGSSERPYTLAEALLAMRSSVKTILLKGGVYSGPHRISTTFNRSEPLTIRPEPGASAVFEGSFYRTGGGIRWQNLEFGVSSWSTRQSSQDGSAPTDIPDNDFNVHAKDQFINCIIHDHNNNGFWAPAEDILVYGTLFYNQGWQAPDRGHGHTAYIQNQTGTKSFKRNVFVSGFSGFTVHAYSEDGTLQGFNFEENVSLGGRWQIGGLVPVSRVTMTRNHIDGGVRLGHSYDVTSYDATLTDNVLSEPLDVRGTWTALNETGTILASDLNRVFVYDNAYDPDRGMVVVYNAGNASEVSVDLTSLPLTKGRRYKLLNTLNPVETFEFNYDSTEVTVPMTGWTVALPVSWDSTVVQNTLPGVGAFLLVSAETGSVLFRGAPEVAGKLDKIKTLQDLPASFGLGASYPNPFNSVSTVPFSLPEDADVEIHVYDLLGRQVATLAQSHFEAGEHQVLFEAANLPSGMYLVQARMKSVGNRVHTFVRKVMLLK